MTAGFAAFMGRAQGFKESLMRDSCVVTVPGSPAGDLDADSWLPVAAAGSVLYTGLFRLRMGGTVAGSATKPVAGDSVSVSTPTASFPVSAPLIPVGAVVVCTAVPADDPAGHLRLGLRVRVTGRVLNQDMSAQRVTVEAVTG